MTRGELKVQVYQFRVRGVMSVEPRTGGRRQCLDALWVPWSAVVAQATALHGSPVGAGNALRRELRTVTNG
jgi:hypothetical protein